MIKLENVSKQYHIHSGWRTVLDDINFEMKGNDKVGFLGRNGAGKSTLIRLISGVRTTFERYSFAWCFCLMAVGFWRCFSRFAAGMDNLRFIAAFMMWIFSMYVTLSKISLN